MGDRVDKLKAKHLEDSAVRVKQYDHQNHGAYYTEMATLAEALEARVKELEEQVKFHKDDAKRTRAYWRNNETPGGDFNMLDPDNMAGP